MLKFLIKKNNHDFLHKYHWLHPSKKIKLIQSSVQTSNNEIIKEQKKILPLYHYLNLYLLQKPKIKLSKKSNASFKIRPNMIIGTANHLHKHNLNNFYNIFITSILPIIKFNTKVTYNNINNNEYHILISYPWNNIKYYKTYNAGAHVQFLIKSPINKLPFLYFI